MFFGNATGGSLELQATGAVDPPANVMRTSNQVAGQCCRCRCRCRSPSSRPCPCPSSTTHSCCNPQVGLSNWPADPRFSGSIRSIFVYDRALTPPELAALAGTSPPLSGLENLCAAGEP